MRTQKIEINIYLFVIYISFSEKKIKLHQVEFATRSLQIDNKLIKA